MENKKKPIRDFFILGGFLEFVNNSIEKKSFAIFSDRIKELEEIISFVLDEKSSNKKYSVKVVSKTMIFIRKILTFLEAFTNEFSSCLIDKILEIGIRKFGKKAEKIEDENHEKFVVEYAETLAR